MKDRVFIAWSGSKEVATLVKDILEKKYNYVCSVGGNSDNNSQLSSVGDTVLQQIKTCNQAIVIFQNRGDGAVSNNLFFELGYVLASYGQKKVHCVKKISENVVLPTDFDNAFVVILWYNAYGFFGQADDLCSYIVCDGNFVFYCRRFELRYYYRYLARNSVL